IRAVGRADAAQRAFWERTIAKGDQRDGDLEEATIILRRHGTLEETRDEANARAAAARDALSAVPQHPLTDMLGDLADYVVARVN
ncbi:MAG: polyprenyl synthetase family protein, partial [Pseudomonadota bacterium]